MVLFHFTWGAMAQEKVGLGLTDLATGPQGLRTSGAQELDLRNSPLWNSEPPRRMVPGNHGDIRRCYSPVSPFVLVLLNYAACCARFRLSQQTIYTSSVALTSALSHRTVLSQHHFTCRYTVTQMVLFVRGSVPC